MSGIFLPHDRSVKQPALGYCSRPECRNEDNTEFRFEVEHDHMACPKCGCDTYPTVGPLVLIHWIIPKEGGPITNGQGQTFALACSTKRAYLATADNKEAATDQPQQVTCQGCLKAATKHFEKSVAKNHHRRILLGA